MTARCPRAERASDLVDDRKACEGYATIEDGEMEVCIACGAGVRYGLVDHAFFGFASACPNKVESAREAAHLAGQAMEKVK